MKYDNEFTCPEGHTFRANAKLHARCSECGKMARRAFATKETITTPEVVETGDASSSVTPASTTKEDSGGLQLIRRGKPKKVVSVATKKTLPKRVNGRFVSSKTPTTVKKTTQLVTKKTVSAGTKKKPTMPRVTKKPPRTAVARHVGGGGSKKLSYADEMMQNYGIRR